jgi:superfamily I DNA/RNA helicase
MKKDIKLSDEQKEIIKAICSKDKDNSTLAISAYAGASKTSTILFALSDNYAWFKNGYMLSFNKKIAEENQADLEKHGVNSIECSTIHSFALKYLRHKGKQVYITNVDSNFILKNYPQMKRFARNLPYAIEEYCKSSIINIEEFCQKNNFKPYIVAPLKKIFHDIFTEKQKYMSFSMFLKWAMVEMEDDAPVMDFIAVDECLTGDTLVEVENGKSRTIKSIVNSLNRGEKVIVKSFNTKTEKFEYKEAINPLISHDRDIVKINTVKNKDIKCTPNHKILTKRGYIRADELLLRDMLIGEENDTVFLDTIIDIEPFGKETVYDFEVKDNHNFLIGTESSKTVVHNCQDLSSVSYRIFQLIKAKKKIGVGDEKQSIQGFLNVVNGLKLMVEDMGAKKLTLSKSFRCSTRIANIVNTICENFGLDMKMYGTDFENQAVEEVAVLTRTNGELIDIAQGFVEANKPFKTGRDLKNIVAQPIYLLNGAYKEIVYMRDNNGEHHKDYRQKNDYVLNFAKQFVDDHIDRFDDFPTMEEYRESVLEYCFELVKQDEDANREVLMSELQLASIVASVKGNISILINILKVHDEWKKKGKLDNCNFSLMTAHTSKGEYNYAHC